MKSSSEHIAAKTADALAGFLETMKGQRLDIRSTTAGFYAAAAVFCSAWQKDPELVDLFGDLSCAAIAREPAPIASNVPFDGRKS